MRSAASTICDLLHTEGPTMEESLKGVPADAFNGKVMAHLGDRVILKPPTWTGWCWRG
jgi:hypothetical protein